MYVVFDAILSCIPSSGYYLWGSLEAKVYRNSSHTEGFRKHEARSIVNFAIRTSNIFNVFTSCQACVRAEDHF
jgi:hypothetical protein